MRWWHSLLIGFSLASWGLAHPMYGFITENDRFLGATFSAITLFMLIYQGLPVAILYFLERLVIRRGIKFLRYYRGLVFALVIMVVMRAVHLEWGLPVIWSSPIPLQVALTLAILTLLISVCIRFNRSMSLLFLYFSLVSVILTGVFVAQVGLVSKLWAQDSAGALPAQRLPDSQLSPVFLLVFDGLGGDVLLKDGSPDANRFPNFSALGRDGAVFTNATSNYLSSQVSFGSLMTGTLFSDDGKFKRGPSGSASNGILGTLMDSGYLVEFYSNIFRCEDEGIHLCRDSVSASGKNVHMTARDFIVWFTPRDISRVTRNLIVRVFPKDVSLRIPFNPIHQNSRSLWNEFVANIDAGSSPGKGYFVHSLLPHQPYEFDRRGNRSDTIDTGVGFDDFEGMSAAYEEQVMFVDTLLGEFVGKLKIEGLYEGSVIIVTGDHGPRSLGLGEAYNGFDTAEDYPAELSGIIPRVPLIIHGPKIVPQVSPLDYQHVDLLPTLLDVLGLPARPNLPGVSAFASQRPARNKVFYGIPNERQPGENVSYVFDPSNSRWRMTAAPVSLN